MLIKDLRFSQELQESLSSAAKQKRIGESKIIAAQAEVESAKLMREASDILNTPAAMQIRYLDTLQNMAKTANSKVIFMPGESGHGKGASSGKAGANYASLDVVSSMI
jgi:regulator of protease activity HflC (stomatin/prohibitin superfamily)